MGLRARDRVGMIAPPPLIYAIPLVAGLLIDWWWPLAAYPHRYAHSGLVAGLLVALAGAALGASAIGLFVRVGTPFVPFTPTTQIVERGPYRFTRNPMYVGLALIVLGIALSVDTSWPVLLLLPALVVVDRGVVVREERYLAASFGRAYEEYCGRVRRWL